MAEIDPSIQHEAGGPSRLAPGGVSRQRLIERAGRPDRTMLAAAGMVGAILAATAILRDPWALLPLVTLAAGITLGPLAIRTGAHPEYAELITGLCVTIAMATAAGMTGGTSSPLVYLLPIGVVMNALRAGPASITLCSLVTAAAFLAASLLEGADTILAEPLPMLAILVMQAGVTIASIALAKAEIRHRGASIVDPLTGLLNRQGLPNRFEELRQQALISAAPITLILLDLDHFKRVNDLYGHDVGDRLLRDVADVIRGTLRRFELVYRIGGEEFLIVLPGLAEWESESIAEQLRLAIDKLGLATEVGITASFGVSGADGEELDFERLYRSADQALYGHDVGDRLLRDVADVIRGTLRRFELVYRIGGEEFLIVLPGLAEWESESIAEQLRLAIDKLGTEVGITASFGVSGADGEELDFERLYRSADQALYRAKRAGRNRVNTSRTPISIS